MCGIVGYTGSHEAAPILIAGLRRLEYRGYDSAGLASLDQGRMIVRKRAGRVRALEELLEHDPAPGGCGISHTRWATHGPANDRNAHPHLGGRGGAFSVAVVHNGVIENYASLRRELEAQGFDLREPDRYRGHRPSDRPRAGGDRRPRSRRCSARCRSWRAPTGSGVVSPKRPGEVVGARFGSPLVVGVGEGEHFLASDPVAMRRTRPGSRSCRTARSSV